MYRNSDHEYIENEKLYSKASGQYICDVHRSNGRSHQEMIQAGYVALEGFADAWINANAL